MYKEVNFKGSRLDFLLRNNYQKCLLEAKSVTLVHGGRALFPDAPTQRGTRQLKTLMEARRKGYEAGVIFTIQREDADLLEPNEEVDPHFSHALRQAANMGVEICAYKSKIKTDEITLAAEVKIRL